MLRLGMTGVLLRIASWLLLAAALLLGFFVAAAGAAVAFGAWRHGGEASGTQLVIWGLIVRGVALQALVPHLLLTGCSWALLVRRVPALDGRWLRLAVGLLVLATLWFPVVGHFLFVMWQPGSWTDYANTLWLMAGGVGAALLLARRLGGRRLAPGALAGSPGPAPGGAAPRRGDSGILGP